MKKNITINMLGVLYNIDEDAYELLSGYLDGMKQYFARHGADSEIAEDIEYRVAELLVELKEQGHDVITIDDVRAICERVGAPEQMEDEDDSLPGNGESEEPSEKSETSEDSDSSESQATADESAEDDGPWLDRMRRRRLYRDEQDKMLGGVLAGLSHYAGNGDALPWRIAFVLLLIIGVPFISTQFFILLYIILWAFMPTARTPEDRLRMRGRKVTTANVQSEILGSASQASSDGRGTVGGATSLSAGGGRDAANGCLTAFVWVFKIGLIAALAFVALILLALVFGVGFPLLVGMGALFTDGMTANMLGIGVLLALLVVVLPIVVLVRGMFSQRSMSTAARIVILLVWIASLVGALLCLQRAAAGVRDTLSDSDSPLSLPLQMMQQMFVHGQYGWDDWQDYEDEGDVAAEPDTLRSDSSVIRVHVKQNQALPPDSAVEVFPEDAI